MKGAKLFQAPAYINKIATLADNTIAVNLNLSQELAAEDVATLFGLKGGAGWFLFKDTEILYEEVPTEKLDQLEERQSKSKRLRAVMYVYWNTKTSKKLPFDVFDPWYDMMMEKDIMRWKGKLED